MGMPQMAVVAAVLTVFGFIGFRRGWLREVVTLGALLLTWLIITALGPDIVESVNRLWVLIRFTLSGGADAPDANAVLDRLRSTPLIDPASPELFYAVLFLIAIVAGYIGGQRLAPRPRSLSTQALGTLAGVVNGYVLTYVLLRYVSADEWLSPSLGSSTSAIADTLGGYLSTLLLVAVGLVMCIALISATRLRDSTGSRSKRPSG